MSEQSDDLPLVNASIATDPDVLHLDAPTDRRPDFSAEALSPRIRIGLLSVLFLVAGLLFVSLFAAMSPRQAAVYDNRGLLGVITIGAALGLVFIMLLVFGALVANNARLGGRERLLWYIAFLVVAPVAVPMYWFKEVWPAPFEPSD